MWAREGDEERLVDDLGLDLVERHPAGKRVAICDVSHSTPAADRSGFSRPVNPDLGSVLGYLHDAGHLAIGRPAKTCSTSAAGTG